MCIHTIQISPPPFQRDNKRLDSLQVCVSVRVWEVWDRKQSEKNEVSISYLMYYSQSGVTIR